MQTRASHMGGPRLLAVCLVALVGAVAIVCGGPPEATTSSFTPEPVQEAPIIRPPTPTSAGAIATGWDTTDEDFGLVVTEEDLLNTTHPLEGHEAPELIGIQGWIDSEPVVLADLRGQVVLLDFWTYSCINCIRTLPSIVEWQEEYGSLGLKILGIHTPEFEFEKDADNLRLAIERYDIAYPVTQDNDYATWKAYGVEAWPAKYLIDADGIVQYAEAGEGGYVALEQSMRYWLKQAGYDVSSVPFDPADYHFDPENDRASNVVDRQATRTREIHAGYRKNRPFHRFPPPRPWILYDHYYENLDSDVLFDDPGVHENQHVYMRGLWYTGPESLTHARTTDDFEDYIAIKYNAKTVNAVLGHGGGAEYEVRVTLDGRALDPGQIDSDIRFDDMGNSYILVDEARMYRLIRTVDYEQHELQLSSKSGDFELFTFTFGAYENLEDN